ncbi:hypothetical protein PR003_g21233 [Phytophthora rubi]|uniref:Uncharacterized protein n=2 Tax=Phytophthora rubi TaxID=129364 RepID=A0A6A3JQS0_9STRA|nr:hypothetical protein PR001_g19654 [Phytophthora rubi]KAE9306473.1 hypothetical protein PR003_g21233 [Phytophthora rubi]
MSDELVKSGVTAFAPPPSPTYRYVISCKADQICISLEDQKSKKQWRTGYLTENAYLTSPNRIGNAVMTDYVSVFVEALDYLVETSSDCRIVNHSELITEKTRRKLTSVDDSLQLELSVKINVRQSTWAAKFVFDLDPISLERIDVLEAKFRDMEDELTAAKKLIEEEKSRKMVYLEACSKNVEKLNVAGQLLWDPIETDEFELSDDGSEVRFLVAGWYTMSLMVFLTPQAEGANIELQKNGKRLESSAVPYNCARNASASIGWNAHFNKNDKLSVIATSSPQRVGADITVARIGN